MSVFEKDRELFEINRVAEADGWTPASRRKANRLHQQIHHPTPRQKVVGFRPGRLSEADEKNHRMQICIKELNDFLDRELRGKNN